MHTSESEEEQPGMHDSDAGEDEGDDQTCKHVLRSGNRVIIPYGRLAAW